MSFALLEDKLEKEKTVRYFSKSPLINGISGDRFKIIDLLHLADVLNVRRR